MSDRKIYLEHEVVAEYQKFACAAEEYQKVSWASEQSMRNRFQLAEKYLPLGSIKKILDVGCGTGMFLAGLAKRFPELTLYGIDITPALTAFATERCTGLNVTIKEQNFLTVQGSYDCISCFGVLQKSDMSLDAFFTKAADLLSDTKGCLWLDTKHTGWQKFSSGERSFETTHIYFSVAEIRSVAKRHGFVEERCLGFLPGKGLEVALTDSDTLIYQGYMHR